MAYAPSSEFSEPATFHRPKWHGDYLFLFQNLILKDFKIRYRNMSLGVFWSLLNPLVMMGVLWFVFTRIFPNNSQPNFGVFVLCGLVPYNFFSLAWVIATTSLVDNAGLIKRLSVPREIIPIASVLSNGVHLIIQMALLLVLVLVAGKGIHLSWLWLPIVWGCEILFVCGLGLIFSSLNIYIRDIRYVVESCNVLLFWLVPIFYSFSIIPPVYHPIYRYNPVAALTMACRDILLLGTAPANSTLVRLTLSSILMFFLGLWVFRRLQGKFYDYL